MVDFMRRELLFELKFFLLLRFFLFVLVNFKGFLKRKIKKSLTSYRCRPILTTDSTAATMTELKVAKCRSDALTGTVSWICRRATFRRTRIKGIFERGGNAGKKATFTAASSRNHIRLTAIFHTSG